MTDSPHNSGEERLVSWKRIAQYLQCSERTARRWEAEEGLPTHRHTQASQSSVFAYRSELDAWLKNRPASENDGSREGNFRAEPGDVAPCGPGGGEDRRHRDPGGNGRARRFQDIGGDRTHGIISRPAMILGIVLVASSIGAVSALQSCSPAVERLLPPPLAGSMSSLSGSFVI